jgi:hypothetical protein
VLEEAGESSTPYAAANERIIEEAMSLANGAPVLANGALAVIVCQAFNTTPSGTSPVSTNRHRATTSLLANGALAVIVWEGSPRGSDDATQQFADLARKRGLLVEEVLTR